MSQKKKKVVVLGLDGATWDLIKPLVDEGHMPNMKKLLEGGVHGKCESTMPAMTAPAWATFSTGKNPGHHGVFDFMLPQDSLQNMKVTTSADVNSALLPEMLKDAGIEPITVNLPPSWPPRRTDYTMITCLLTQNDQFVSPESLKEEFPELQQYRLTPDESVRYEERREEYIEDLLRHVDEQMAVVKRLFLEKPWEFFFYLFSHTDWVSHLAYTDLFEKHDASPLRVFKRVDEYLGWFVEHLPEDTNLILVSDHGFKAYKKIFYFNRWLEKEGYLKTTSGGDEFRVAATRRAKEMDKSRSGKKRINLSSGAVRFLSTVPVLEKAAKWTYNRVVKPYLPIDVKVNIGIDFSRTKVCFPKGSYITSAYINKEWVYSDGTVSKEEYPRLLEEVINKMRAITDAQGNRVIKRVLTRDEVYGDNIPDTAPDIFFELDEYWLVGQFQSTQLFEQEEHNKHGQFGIFLGYGPDFAAGKTVEGMKLQDMTPTILHLFGQPIPDDCDGKVQVAVFAESSDAAHQHIQKSKTSGDEKKSIQDALSSIRL